MLRTLINFLMIYFLITGDHKESQKCNLYTLLESIPSRIFKKMNTNTGDPPSNEEKCSCDKSELVESDSSNSESPLSSKDKKSKISLFSLRRARPLHFASKRSKKSPQPSSSTNTSIKKSPKWSIKFNCTKKEPKVAFNQENQNCCRCTCYRRTNDTSSNTNLASNDVGEKASPDSSSTCSGSSNVDADSGENRAQAGSDQSPDVEIEQADGIRGIYSTAPATSSIPNIIITAPFLDMQWMRSSHEDCEEAARIARAREIEQGVEAPANFRSLRRVQLLCSDVEAEYGQSQIPTRLQLVCPPDLSVESLRALFQNNVTLTSCPLDTIPGCHTQVDFIHCLVPDLLNITNCSFYWGKMDRYEAERLLDGKPEGTFLLRDSAQEEFLFSVSFRKYSRSLHARIEQWNHKFSFDSHDPGVFTSDTVCGLIEHYKDPSSCMFFEPVLTWPLHRNFTFSLQHLARAVIVSRLTYDNINHLQLPKTLKTYLKEYHYRQKVRVERFDEDVQWLELRNMPT
ncbi:hypothetical protein NQ315_015570 [Exocentrus adspersus]|uniref:Suppressor of cytokine signaling 5 n=1 Tax=Exocentrus adspersus TaxID=1586481 RepID=A0AAV8V9Z8_9CUCU|nr:hypothetical protein NQ315_015570 [Exocentrus adspersus]